MKIRLSLLRISYVKTDKPDEDNRQNFRLPKRK